MASPDREGGVGGRKCRMQSAEQRTRKPEPGNLKGDGETAGGAAGVNPRGRDRQQDGGTEMPDIITVP